MKINGSDFRFLVINNVSVICLTIAVLILVKRLMTPVKNTIFHRAPITQSPEPYLWLASELAARYPNLGIDAMTR